MKKTSRRKFVQTAAMAAVVMASGATPIAAAQKQTWTIALFEKPLEFLNYRELGEVLAEIGFDGIEATVRRGGHISPERAVDELPGCVEALRAAGLKIHVMATSVSAADEPHTQALLRTAAKLGIKRYRLGGLSYNRKLPILKQLDELKPRWRDLAALNRELGITGLFQNHAGSQRIGAPVWDLHHLLRDIDPKDLGVAYDIRHAMVEGSSAWPISWRLIQPWIGAYYVKDFVCNGAKPKNVPIGQGIVGKSFYSELKRLERTLPVSLHVPHLGRVKPSNRKEAIAAIGADFKLLKALLG